MKDVYLTVLQDLDGKTVNIICDTLEDLSKLIANLNSDEYVLLNITIIPSCTNGWADFCSKNNNLERG